MDVLDLPPVDAERLLEVLRSFSDSPALGFAEPPEHLAAGGEAVVDAFRLSGAPPGFEGPLVLRRLRVLKDPGQVRREQTVHDALFAQGYPVPRVLMSDASAEALGAPFLVMARVPGGILLEEATEPGSLLARPARLPGLIREALMLVPRLLAEVQAHLHSLDVAPVRTRLLEAGCSPDEVEFSGRLESLERRVDAAGLEGLKAGLAWLRSRQPAASGSVVCHGDLVFTNVCVEAGRVTGVLDWSHLTLAEPAYDVAGTLARLDSAVPEVPAPLGPVFRAAQHGLSRRYRRDYEAAWPLDPERLDYYGAYWVLSELAWSGERLRAGARPDGAIERRWLHTEVIEAGVERLASITGVRVTPRLPERA